MPLGITAQEEVFYNDFYTKTIWIIAYISSRFFDSQYTFIRGALKEMDFQENAANERYRTILARKQEGFRRTLDPLDPLCRCKLAVKFLWDSQHLVDEEVGHPSPYPLYQETEDQVFCKRRTLTYLLKDEAEIEKRYFFQLLEKLQLPDTKICEESGDTQTKLKQFALAPLREAYVCQMTQAFNAQIDRLPDVKHIPTNNASSLEFPRKGGSLNNDLINRLSCLAFRTFEKMGDKGSADLQLACRVGQAHLHIIETGLIFFSKEALKKRGTSCIVHPQTIFEEIQAWMHKLKKQKEPMKVQKKMEDSFLDSGVELFKMLWGKSKEPPNDPPSFFSKIGGQEGAAFHKKWLELREILTIVADLLRKKQLARVSFTPPPPPALFKKKASMPSLTHDQLRTSLKKPSLPEAVLPFPEEQIEREGSAIINEYIPKNKDNENLVATLNALQEIINLMDLVEKEIVPPIAKPRALILRNNTPTTQIQDNKLRLLELIGILEALVVEALRQWGASSIIWEEFFDHLDKQEAVQNERVCKELNREMRSFETSHAALKTENAQQYCIDWARKHVETQKKLMKTIHMAEDKGRLTLPLMQDNLQDPVEKRILVRVLNRAEGLPPDYTVVTFMADLKKVRLDKLFKIATKDEKICAAYNYPIIHGTQQVIYWLKDTTKQINKKKFNPTTTPAAFYKSLKTNEATIALAAVLLGVFESCVKLKQDPFFPITFQSLVIKEGRTALETISPRLKDLSKELEQQGKIMPTRESSYSSSDLTKISGAVSNSQVLQLGREASESVILLGRLKEAPVVRDQLEVCVKLMTFAAHSLSALPTKMS